MTPETPRTAPPLALALLGAALCAAAGCASDEPRAGSPEARASASYAATTSGSDSASLYSIEDMRQARLRREVGEEYMERAYETTDEVRREHNFGLAMKEFRAAEDHYHEVLTQAAPRYKEVVDSEIAQVMTYMRQILRDRATPKPQMEPTRAAALSKEAASAAPGAK